MPRGRLNVIRTNNIITIYVDDVVVWRGTIAEWSEAVAKSSTQEKVA